jgi:hypothetical protein
MDMDPENQFAADGDIVKAGQPLGLYADTYKEAICGGGSGGQHAHWSVWKDGKQISISGLTLSGYKVFYDPNGEHYVNEPQGNCPSAYFEQDGKIICPFQDIQNQGG